MRNDMYILPLRKVLIQWSFCRNIKTIFWYGLIHSKYNRHLALWAAAESATSFSWQPSLKKNKNLSTTLLSILFVSSCLKLLTTGKQCRHPVEQLPAYCGIGVSWAWHGISVFINYGCIFLLWNFLTRIYMHHNISVYSKLSSLSMPMQEKVFLLFHSAISRALALVGKFEYEISCHSLCCTVFRMKPFPPQKKLKNLFRFQNR